MNALANMNLEDGPSKISKQSYSTTFIVLLEAGFLVESASWNDSSYFVLAVGRRLLLVTGGVEPANRSKRSKRSKRFKPISRSQPYLNLPIMQ